MQTENVQLLQTFFQVATVCRLGKKLISSPVLCIQLPLLAINY